MSDSKGPVGSPPKPPKTCDKCQGRGWVDKRCSSIHGDNRCSLCDGKGFDAGGKECRACKGTGLIETRTVDRDPCPQCGGAGVFPVPPSMGVWQYAYQPGRKR